MTDEKKKRLTELIEEIKDIGCCCDLLYGFQCSIHGKLAELKIYLELEQ